MTRQHWGMVPNVLKQRCGGIFKGWDVQEECCRTGGCMHIQRWCNFSNIFLNIPTSEDKTTTLSRNVGNQSPCDVVSHPKRTNTSATPLQKLKNLHSLLYLEEPTMSPYMSDAAYPEPRIIFMIHFITTLPSMSGTLSGLIFLATILYASLIFIMPTACPAHYTILTRLLALTLS
jgi:hypothetical protein